MGCYGPAGPDRASAGLRIDPWRSYFFAVHSATSFSVAAVSTGGLAALPAVIACFAVAFAEYASRLGTLVEAVNILGSLFYGTILGIFLTAFYLKRVGGTAVFVAALIAEVVVIACFKLTAIGFLWYNLIGCGLVLIFALALSVLWPSAGKSRAVRAFDGAR